MSFDHVVKLSQARRDIFERAIMVIMENYPDKNSQKTQPVELFKSIVNKFFLTDVLDDNSNEDIMFEDFDYEHIVPETELDTSTGSNVGKNIKGSNDSVGQRKLRIKSNGSNDSVGQRKQTIQLKGSNDSVGLTKQTIQSKESNDSVGLTRQTIQSKGSNDSVGLTIQSDDNTFQPMTRRKRLSQKSRIKNETIFMSSKSVHMYDGDENKKIENKNGVLNDPKKVIGILIAATHFFLLIPEKTVTINLDILMLFFFSFFVAGFRISTSDENKEYVHTESPVRKRADSSSIAKRVFFGEKSDISRRCNNPIGFGIDPETPINGVLQRFPDGAELGTVSNCWSPSDYQEFHVRGSNYLIDRKKIPSEEYIFKPRGVELFLSDCCPAHIGR